MGSWVTTKTNSSQQYEIIAASSNEEAAFVFTMLLGRQGIAMPHIRRQSRNERTLF